MGCPKRRALACICSLLTGNPGRVSPCASMELCNRHAAMTSGLRLVDLAGIGEDAESFAGGGEAEGLVQADEIDAMRVLAAPDQGGGELQGPTGAQRMDGED